MSVSLRQKRKLVGASRAKRDKTPFGSKFCRSSFDARFVVPLTPPSFYRRDITSFGAVEGFWRGRITFLISYLAHFIFLNSVNTADTLVYLFPGKAASEIFDLDFWIKSRCWLI
jgi:hypothetical protein